MTGADEANGTDGIAFEMLAQFDIEREEGRLHRFHEDAVVGAGGGEDAFELIHVEGGGLFAEDMFSGGDCLEAKLGVGVGMGGYVDGVCVDGKQGFEIGGDCGNREFICVGLSAIGVAAPDGGQVRIGNSCESVGEAGSCAAGAYDAEANELHEIRVARGG